MLQECPQGSPSFINQQCAATNNRPFNGVLHTWKEFTGNGKAASYSWTLILNFYSTWSHALSTCVHLSSAEYFGDTGASCGGWYSM